MQLFVLLEATGRLPPVGDPGRVSGKGPPCLAACPGPRPWPPHSSVPRPGGSGLRLLVPSEGGPSALMTSVPQRGLGHRLSLETGKRHHPDMFLKRTWNIFRERFIFASGLLPDTDSIFWENAGPWLTADESGGAGWLTTEAVPGRAGPRSPTAEGCAAGAWPEHSLPWRSPSHLRQWGRPAAPTAPPRAL